MRYRAQLNRMKKAASVGTAFKPVGVTGPAVLVYCMRDEPATLPPPRRDALPSTVE